METTYIRQTQLSRPTWQKRQHEHRVEVDQLLGDYLDRRKRGKKDPVLDFLFQYYHFRPGQLRRWSPGINVWLEDAKPSDLELAEAVKSNNGVIVDPGALPDRRYESLAWMQSLLQATQKRRPHFGCFGLHEWAMVYRTDNIRHHYLDLRLSPDRIAEVVESRPLKCTHYDAFRFFTPKARPLNRHQLERDDAPDMEQGGCVHTNMDLYKWAYKIDPWINSELLLDTFKLALRARKIDMQASPYDMRPFGLKPIKIETEQGRSQYVRYQKGLWEDGRPIRERLIEAFGDLMAAVERDNCQDKWSKR